MAQRVALGTVSPYPISGRSTVLVRAAMDKSSNTRRAGDKWHKFATAYKARCKAQNLPCAKCELPIDYDAEAFTPRAFECGHKISVRARPDLIYSHNNVQPEHCACNRSNRKRDPEPPPLHNRWVRPSW
jgi:hypothetical protein